VSTLSDYLNTHLPADWSKPQLVDALAGVVDRATVYRYLSGRHPRSPSETILSAFSEVLPGTTLQELRAAAAALDPDADDPWIPPIEANRLNSGQRAALTAFIRATVNWQENVEEAELAEVPRPIDVDPNARPELEEYVEKLHASGLSDLAGRVAATLATNSASETASKSSKS
jgi:hypothetical protein